MAILEPIAWAKTCFYVTRTNLPNSGRSIGKPLDGSREFEFKLGRRGFKCKRRDQRVIYRALVALDELRAVHWQAMVIVNVSGYLPN